MSAVEASEVRARVLIRRMREGRYATRVNGQVVTTAFTDGDTIREVADLLVVLGEEHSSGSPNLEIAQIRGMGGDLESGKPLTAVQQALLGKLLAKYGPEIRLLRRSPDRQGQDFLAVPTQGAGR
jgi:hypothetical protein